MFGLSFGLRAPTLHLRLLRSEIIASNPFYAHDCATAITGPPPTSSEGVRPECPVLLQVCRGFPEKRGDFRRHTPQMQVDFSETGLL